MFAVIFDMDGTLLDTQRICIPAWEYAGKKQGTSDMGRHVINVCGMNKEGSDQYLRENFPHIDVDLFKEDSRQYIIKNGKVEFKEGAKEILEFLRERKIKFALATGTSRESTMSHLEKLKIADYFDVIICGTEIERGKPYPDIFLKCAKEMSIAPENCFVFEDSENGVRAGISAKMKTVGIADIKPFSNEIKEKMYLELKNLTEARKMLEEQLI